VADIVDEIVVVDTGSTDRTKEIAIQYGARVVDFPWVDSFAAARNEALRHASGDWIFWMDADDRLDTENRAKLQTLLDGLDRSNVAYSLKCLCLPDHNGGPATVVDHIRLFPKRPEIRWKYRVHEQILPALRAGGGQIRWADVTIHHAGYQDGPLRRRKLDRDLRLLHLEDADNPDDPFTLFNLGSVYQELGDFARAVPLLRRSLARSQPQDSIVRKLYALIVQAHRQMGQAGEAAAACAEGRVYYPDDTELLFLEALIHREQGNLAAAEAALLRLLERREEAHFASLDTGLSGYKARHNLAVIYQDKGRHAEAEAQWQAALAEAPNFIPAALGLAEVYLAQERWEAFEASLARFQADPRTAVEAAVLKARRHLAEREYRPARTVLEDIIEQAPKALWPRVILSHVLLQEGRELAAAEHALCEILALAPDHREARHNLTVLLEQRGRAPNSKNGPPPTLEDLYHTACARSSDINEHLPKLFTLAKDCRRITELGTRTAVSTTAFLYAQPERLICYDVCRWPEVDELQAVAGRTRFVFREANVLQVEIDETDLLFIDTWHVYDQLKKELQLHAPKTKKYIVLHDTATFGERGETDGHRGLWPAVEEFVAEGSFRIKERLENNNGLTVLERV
jgi:tetratricopeptide (TPR) repeat protein